MDCIFCKIVNGDIPSKKVYEDEKILAFYDLSPEAPVHVLIVPKIHIESTMDISLDNIEYISHIMLKAKEIAKDLKIDETGFRIVTNVGKDGGQTVNHLHYHMLGGRNLKWPPG